MAVGVSFTEIDVPVRSAAVGRIDGTARLVADTTPVPITGQPRPVGVASRRATGLPKLLTAFTARPVGVAGRAALGAPSFPAASPPVIVQLVLAASADTRRAVGGPAVASATPPPPSTTPAWLRRLIDFLRRLGL